MQLLCVMMLFFCLTSCAEINKRLGLPNNNPAEAGVQYLIEKETGAKVDLTPSDTKGQTGTSVDKPTVPAVPK